MNNNRTLEALKLARDIIRDGMEQGHYPSVGNYAFITEAIAAAEQEAAGKPPVRYHLLWPERWSNHPDEVYQEHRSFMTEKDLVRSAIEQNLPYDDGITIYGYVVDLNNDLINQLTAEKCEQERLKEKARQETQERAEYERLKKKYEENQK